MRPATAQMDRLTDIGARSIFTPEQVSYLWTVLILVPAGHVPRGGEEVLARASCSSAASF